jgi:hypothetical protein
MRLRLTIEPHGALVKIIYAGVNASDVSHCILFSANLLMHDTHQLTFWRCAGKLQLRTLF